jgi:SAM-dependent methyltransferase
VRNLDFITYALVGIEPPAFYAGKFAGGPGVSDYLGRSDWRWNIEFDRVRFLCEGMQGPRVLDLGCGSGPYAATIRAHSDVAHLTGVDLDPNCVDIAAETYDAALTFDLGRPLPFADATFDTVFSCDVWGHIEFRDKDHLLSEVARVTRPDGRSVHVIESGFVDYEAMRHDDPEDPVRRYVWMEGHIGVETAQELHARWSRFFKRVHIENAFVPPLVPLYTYMVPGAVPDELAEVFRGFDERERNAAHVALGYVSRRLREMLQQAGDDRLTPDHRSDDPLRHPCGLVYLVAEDPLPSSS